MYCTGGILCEKASAWMKHNGFNKVWHIEGGIIDTPAAPVSRVYRCVYWEKLCLDERMGERISEDVIAHCHQCAPRYPHQLQKRRLPLFIQVPGLCLRSLTVAEANCAVKRVSCRKKSSVGVAAGTKTATRFSINHAGRLNTKLGIP